MRQMMQIPLLSTIKSQISRMDPVALSRTVFGFTLLLCITFAGTSVYFYSKYQMLKKAADMPKVLSAEEVRNPQTVVNAISDLVYLPTNEPLQTATVTDISQLPDDPFFKRAENGDKVIILRDSGRAILFRPSINKVVDISTISFETESETTASESATPAQTLPGSTGQSKTLFPKAPLKLN